MLVIKLQIGFSYIFQRVFTFNRMQSEHTFEGVSKAGKTSKRFVLVCCSSVAQNRMFMFPIELLQLGVTIVRLIGFLSKKLLFKLLLFKLYMAKAISSLIFVVDLN